MELDELEVGDGRARAVGQRDALAERAGRIRRALPQSAAPPVASSVAARGDRAPVGDDADAASAATSTGR